ncbi:hypothetical protein MesoLj131c_62800 [Mesorhizobium sp. 131-3-5]|uniref:hypothetical protein n=1 Tax=Mesorhizobium sp. 131-3-5 TaxID=2744520 RepID=UPI0019276AE3|nr:hypothetical protein [Mesorhizobium sp. 131-3-5]BCH12022.1 hypothetical protein MesoLj131c_62800 [Mesorhizobium sp. 131-3-5]
MTWLIIPIAITALIALWLWRRRGRRDFNAIDDLEMAIYAVITTWLLYAVLLTGGWL